jgi:hypothetical protein
MILDTCRAVHEYQSTHEGTWICEYGSMGVYWYPAGGSLDTKNGPSTNPGSQNCNTRGMYPHVLVVLTNTKWISALECYLVINYVFWVVGKWVGQSNCNELERERERPPCQLDLEGFITYNSSVSFTFTL